MRQDAGLVFVLFQQVEQFRDLAQPQHRHAAFDPADQRAVLVVRKVVAGDSAQQLGDPRNGLDDIGPEDFRAAFVNDRATMADHLVEPPGDLFGRQDEVHHPGRHGAVGHPRKPRAAAVLNEREAALGLDPAQALRPVAAGARQDHAIGVALLGGGEGPEEGVDRPVQAVVLVARRQMEPVVGDGCDHARRHDIDLIGLDHLLARDLRDRQVGAGLQQLVQDGFLVRGQMLDDDIGRPGRRLDPGDQFPQRLEAAGRGADGHDRNGRLRVPSRIQKSIPRS